jgi:hypothetical protein
LVGVCLHPSAASTFFQLLASKLTDTCVGLTLLPTIKKALAQQLQEAAIPEQQVFRLASLLPLRARLSVAF